MHLIIHTDGGARGNPGQAAVGVVIEKVHSSSFTVHGNKEIVSQFGKRIGETTNNIAEYSAVVEALHFITQNLKSKMQKEETLTVEFFLDSTLVVNQLNGLFKVKDVKLRELLFKVRELEQETGGNIQYQVIPREQNSRADNFVNKALDDYPHVSYR